ncbi:hypothetical protein [Paenibacillus lautus]|uniref:hypothetical protein n=1 Tax=Paenibacillus lautus TaxID=1401 RepID=UPI001C7E143E|nr:hypothetical protein [Paenibacillus lautus]
MGVIKDQEVEVKWAYRSKTYYIKLGIPYTKIGDSFKVAYKMLPQNANVEVLIECNNCGKQVYKNLQGLRDREITFCSPSCTHESKKRRVAFNCDSCGKRGEKTYYQFNKHKYHFCNNECSSKFDRSYTPVTSCICKQCNENYDVALSQHKRYGSKFCSMKCRNKWESINIRGKNHHRYNKLQRNCNYCDTTIEVSRYKISEEARHFCNTHCRQRWYAEVWSQQPHWKKECAKRAIEMLNKGLFKHTNTSCQNAVNSILSKLSIDFINEYDCKYYSIDNYLPEHNLMIEVMGSFWHCDPRVYKEAKYEIQSKRIIKDLSKNKYIKKYYGINILYLWEKDIVEDPLLCQKLIELYIKDKGILDDFHSFNYELYNNEVKVRESLLNPYFNRIVFK